MVRAAKKEQNAGRLTSPSDSVVIDFEPLLLPDQLPLERGALQALIDHTHQQATRRILDALTAQIREHAFNDADARAQAIAMATIERYLEQITLERRRLFGASSEKFSAGQFGLFNEAEVALGLAGEDGVLNDTNGQLELPAAPDDKKAKTATPDKKTRGKRAPLPVELERVRVVIEIDEADRLCACGTPMVAIGQEISEQLDIVPMRLRVIQTVRMRYACPDTKHGDDEVGQKLTTPKTAPMPAQPLPKTNATANLLALLIVVKFLDGLPLARVEHVWGRSGVRVPRNTLARWIIACSQLLQPLFNLARDALHEGRVIHMDETPVQVLKAPKDLPDKLPTSMSYMWVQTGGVPGKAVTLFDYDPSRSGQVPVRLLAGWQGYLMTDYYGGYNAVGQQAGIESLACMAHVRRKFVDAQKVQKTHKAKNNKTHTPSLADQAITMIAQLYGIEKEFKNSTDQERYDARQQYSVAVLEKLNTWRQAYQPAVPPESTLGKAMSYLENCWSRLVRYTEAGDLPIDNNRCENAIRPFVIGRKAWLFSDTPAGANSSAILYSLIETAKANGVEPSSWINYVMNNIARAKTVDDYDALMPWNTADLPRRPITN
jgi:transposase